MKTFLKNLGLFLLPLLALMAPPFIVLLVSGEFIPLHTIEELSRGKQTILVGTAYNDFRLRYQLDETIARHPEVLALGSSRMGTFRAAFFNNTSVFYNATGGNGNVLSGYHYFVEELSTPPRIIIASMDPFMFQPENAKNRTVTRPNPFTVRIKSYDPFLESFFRDRGWWKTYADYFAGKFTLDDVSVSRTTDDLMVIGLRAAAYGGGFTNDGSDYYGTFSQRGALSEVKKFAATITETNGDEFGSGVYPEAIAELRTFLSESKAKGITVIGMIPAIAPMEYERLRSFPHAYYAEAFRNLGNILTVIYREYGFDLYDFRDITEFGSSDAEMIDPKHASEKMSMRMFIHMAKQNKKLGAYANIPYLMEKLISATSTFEVFGLR